MNAFSLAFSELRRNWSRTLLTSLGILIGVASVIAMVGIGRGATASIEADLASMGTNLLMVEPGVRRGPQSRGNARPFRLSDVERIAREVPYTVAVSPSSSSSTTLAYEGLTYDTSVTGANEGYLTATGWSVLNGRNFSSTEAKSGAQVCLLGDTVVESLFEGANPIGASMRVGSTSCTVIGTLVAKGEDTMGRDQDDVVLAPFPLVQRRLLGTTDVSNIFVSIDDEAHLDLAIAALDATMRDLRSVTTESTVDYTIRDTREMASRMSSITGVLTGLLAAVAGVSLLVGGIGIMNIMLVSVTERTREIGIRMSIGALEEDVMLQFLTEATVLAAFGGLLGCMVGIGITGVVSLVMGIPFVVEPIIAIGSVLFSALMGIFFGWMPARRAARLEPIDALRS